MAAHPGFAFGDENEFHAEGVSETCRFEHATLVFDLAHRHGFVQRLDWGVRSCGLIELELLELLTVREQCEASIAYVRGVHTERSQLFELRQEPYFRIAHPDAAEVEEIEPHAVRQVQQLRGFHPA